MAGAVTKKHYFVINQLGQSADRRGPFASADAARKWAEEQYHYPAWIVPAEPVGKGLTHMPLDENGQSVQEG
jgi:hypothetical protein